MDRLSERRVSYRASCMRLPFVTFSLREPSPSSPLASERPPSGMRLGRRSLRAIPWHSPGHRPGGCLRVVGVEAALADAPALGASH